MRKSMHQLYFVLMYVCVGSLVIRSLSLDRGRNPHKHKKNMRPSPEELLSSARGLNAVTKALHGIVDTE